MQKITPCLWFDDRIEEAVSFYVSVFKDASILDVNRYGEGGPMPAGTVLTMRFVLNGQEFLALNGGPQYSFTEAVSFMVDCKDQAEVDYYWDRLIADGGEESMCGWLKDRYGLSWQVVPEALPRLINGPDKAGAGRAVQAMLKMTKIVVPELERAYAG